MHNDNAIIPAAARRVSAAIFTAALLALAALGSPRVPAQGSPVEPLTAEELEILVGPIALYPDEVLAVVLPASTYPLEIVQAARFLEDRAADATLEPSDEWDDSIVALLNYPDVVRLMNDDLDWTWDLGEAVLDDQGAVLDAIQAFRDRAYDAGNLVSDDRQVITQEEGAIAIEPADPEVVYIPYYEPAAVVVYQPRPVFHYYPYAYPLYYYPYPVGYRFSTGFFWGVTSAFVIGWDTHLIHLHHHTHYRHPFYRRTYYTPYYARRGINVTVNVNNYRDVWRPRQVRGARPYDGVRAVRSGDRIYRNYDGRRYRNTDRTYNGGARTVQRNAPRTSPTRDQAERRTTATLPRQGAGRSADVSPRNGGLRQGTIDRYRERNNNARTSGSGRAALPNADRSNRSREPVAGQRPNTFAGIARDGRTGTRTLPDRTAPRANPNAGTNNRSGTSRAPVYRQPAIRSVPRAVPDRGSATSPRTAPQRSAPARTAPRTGIGRTEPPRRVTAAPAPQQRAQIQSRGPASPSSRVPTVRPQARAPSNNRGGSRFGGVAPQRQSRPSAGNRPAPANRARQSQGGSGNRGRVVGAPRGER